MRAALALVLALAVLPPAAWAGDGEEIEPDRSGLSTSTATVGRGAVQVEAGFNYGHERMGGSPTEKRFGLEAAVRVGLTEALEVGVVSEPLVRLRGSVSDTGHGDVTLQAKYRFLDERAPWPSLGLLPYVTLPVTEEPFGSGKTDAGLVLLASFGLPWQLSLDANAGLAALGQSRPAGYLLQAFAAAGLSRDLGAAFTLFGDLVYASREARDGRGTVLLDAGVIYRPVRRVALDASIVTALAGSAPDWTMRAGVSVRLGR
jgi:hypothetical protein